MDDVASADLQRGVEDLALDQYAAGNKELPCVVDDVNLTPPQKNEGSVSEDDRQDMEEESEEEEEEFDEEAFRRKLLQGYYYDPPLISSGYCTNCVPDEICKSCGHINGRHFSYKRTSCVICGKPEHDDFGCCSPCLLRPAPY